MTGRYGIARCAVFVVLSLSVLSACETSKNGDIAAPLPTSPAAVAVPSRVVQASDGGASQAAPKPIHREVAVLAGGCFWGMEDILRDIPGVLDTEVGFAGGTLPSPRYEDVKMGQTGHAESVRLVFDPSRLSYEDLLLKWFFRMHDPTTSHRQGNDVGSQYRSVIFYETDAQRKTALAVIQKVNASEQWDDPVVTELVPAGAFTAAENYHQDYLEKNPGGYTCHYMREPTL